MKELAWADDPGGRGETTKKTGGGIRNAPADRGLKLGGVPYFLALPLVALGASLPGAG